MFIGMVTYCNVLYYRNKMSMAVITEGIVPFLFDFLYQPYTLLSDN